MMSKSARYDAAPSAMTVSLAGEPMAGPHARTISRAVGALFLIAFVLYLGGSALVTSTTNDVDMLAGVAGKAVYVSGGALLMLLNSVVVVAIGVLVFPILNQGHETAAYTYLVARLGEAVMLAIGVLWLLLLIPLGEAYDAGRGDVSLLTVLAKVAEQGDAYAYQFAMVSLGIGSLAFCRVLFKERLVPRTLAAWGFLGYGIFLAGAILEILGLRVGLVLSVPGGLFEVAFGAWLLTKGFRESAPPSQRAVSAFGGSPNHTQQA